MTVLDARDVTKVYREGSGCVAVLNGASLALDRGEIVALEGPSGSGKTTFLTILGCMLTPCSGRLTLEGRDVDPTRPDLLPALRRASIGFVFQQFHLFPALTAAENIEYVLNLKGVKGPAARRERGRLLSEVGLSQRATFLPRDLSGGQKQRVAIARALAGRAPILLADEPTANLDHDTGAQVLDLFQGLARRDEALVARRAAAMQDLDRNRHSLETARARHAAAQAQRARSQALIAKTRIIAPIDGVVTARHVHPGEMVGVGDRILTIADLSRLRIEAEVDEFDAARIAPGARVALTAEGHPGTQWRGTVEEIPDAVIGRRLRPQDPGRPIDARVLAVKIAFGEATPLKLGQKVEVEFQATGDGSTAGEVVARDR